MSRSTTFNELEDRSGVLGYPAHPCFFDRRGKLNPIKESLKRRWASVDLFLKQYRICFCQYFVSALTFEEHNREMKHYGSGLCENPTVLLVEDDPNDVFLMQRAFQKNGIHEDLQIVENGRQAVAYLSGEGEFVDRRQFPFPNLVITDLKMPIMNGLQLLDWMNSESYCQPVLKVLLSSSNFSPEQSKAYESGVCCCHVKPVSPNELAELVKKIYEFWRNQRNNICNT